MNRDQELCKFAARERFTTLLEKKSAYFTDLIIKSKFKIIFMLTWTVTVPGEWPWRMLLVMETTLGSETLTLVKVRSVTSSIVLREMRYSLLPLSESSARNLNMFIFVYSREKLCCCLLTETVKSLMSKASIFLYKLLDWTDLAKTLIVDCWYRVWHRSSSVISSISFVCFSSNLLVCSSKWSLQLFWSSAALFW